MESYYEKESLHDHIKGYLSAHTVSEVMQIVTDVIEEFEWESAENE